MSKKLENLIIQTYEMQVTVKELEEQIATNKTELQKYFESDKLAEVKELFAEDIKVQQIESAYISYNGNMLEKSLKANNKKGLIKQTIKKTYTIINIQAFMELIKLTAITPFEIKGHIRVNREVNKKAVQDLFAKGEIEKQDLDNCFESKVVKSIRFSKMKLPEGD